MTTNNPLLKVVAAEYVREYTLRLTFSTGEVRLVDFTPLMQKGICRKLQDLEYFKSIHLDPFTVDWNNEIGELKKYGYLVPASSVKGALAHRIAYHYNKLTDAVILPNGTLKNGKEIEDVTGSNNDAVRLLFLRRLRLSMDHLDADPIMLYTL